MVNSILQYIEPQLKAYMQFLNRVDSPVFRISNGEMIKGNGQEKEVVTISDLNGNSLYIRQTQPETINERKALSSCDKEYNISARCKLVFYTFGGNDFTINPDKVKSKIINTLARLDFSHYTGSSTEIKIDINGTSLDIEKIYTEETGKEFTGNVWPTLVSVDFTLSYVDTNCNTCDIDDSETVVTWTPDLTPENCETKAICEVISKCDVITLLQEQTASLQEQIDNLPQSGLTCTDLPNCQTIIDILQSINDIISGLPSSYFSCADLEFCQTIIDIVSDISALQTQVGTNTTDISTLQGQVSSLISDLGTLTPTVQSVTGVNVDNTDTVNPKLPIPLPVEFDLNAYGDSITIGFYSTSSPLAYINLLGTLYGKTVYNRAVSGKGIWEAARDHLFDIDPTDSVLSVIMAGLNDVRRGGSSAKTTVKILNGYKSIIANQFLNSFIPAGQTSSFITRSGAWINTYLGKSVGCKTDNGSYSNTNYGYIEYTFTGNNVVLGLVGGDGISQIHADFTVSIDGVSQGSYTENNQTDGISDGSYDNKRSAMCLVFTGLTNEIHTIRLTNTTTNFLIVDYFGHLKDAKFCAPLLIMHAPKLSTAGYAIVPNLANDTIINTLNSNLTALLTFLPEYPVYIGKTNDFYDITTGLDTDQIHPNDVGHHQIFCSAREALRYIPYLGTVSLNGYEVTSNKSTSVATDQSSNVKYPTVKSVYDWATSLFATVANLALKAPIASPTFTGTVTTPALNISGQTASTVPYLDASKNLVSSSVTPTTLGYLDATSSIQTQFDALNNKTLFKTTSNSSTHTGTLSNTIIYSEDISGKLASGDIAEIVSDVVRVSGSTSATIRYYLNSSNSLTGATAIGVYTYGFSGLNIADFRRQLIVKSSTSIRIKGASSSLLNDYGVFSNYTDVSVNLGSLWIIFAITLGNTGDQFLVSSRKMVK